MSQQEPALLVCGVSGRPDNNYVIYKDRKVLICPRELETGPYSENAPVVRVGVEPNTIEGVLSVERVVRFGENGYQLRHWIVDNGPYSGYSAPVTIGFDTTEEQLMKFFYPYYFQERDGSKWRCPAQTLEEAWPFSQEFGDGSPKAPY